MIVHPAPIAQTATLTPGGARLAEVLARIARRLTSDNRPPEDMRQR